MRRASMLASALVAGAGCGAASEPPRAPPKDVEEVARPAASRPVRLFLAAREGVVWVSHDGSLDRVVASGSRLELARSGEVTAAAWDVTADRGDVLQGSLALAPHLGGGFVHWTRTALFRSDAFTGPLTPVALPSAPPTVTRVLGARNGPQAAVILTDRGPFTLARGLDHAVPLAMPAVSDLAAMGPSLAVRLDLLGRTSTSTDGGAHFTDTTPEVGLAARALYVTDTEIAIDTWTRRFVVTASGAPLEPASVERPAVDPASTFQTFFPRSAAFTRHAPPAAWGELTPLAAAIASGVAMDGDLATASLPGAVVRVDRSSGEVAHVALDALPVGLRCEPVRAPDGALFACMGGSSGGAGAYVMRSERGEPPVLERAFEPGGSFIAGPSGELAYTRPCAMDTRAAIEEDEPQDADTGATLCVRRGPGAWSERSLGAASGASLLAWVPRDGGRVIALVTALETEAPALPRAGGEDVVVDREGVRVVRIAPRGDGWQWPRGGPSRASAIVDRSFEARPDGAVTGWVSPPEGRGASAIVGAATIERDGAITVHPLPPDAVAVSATGRFGLAMDARGALHETLDHGRSWRAAGPSPVPPGMLAGTCSALGCTLGGLVRSGWGVGVAARVDTALKTAPVLAVPRPRLVCAPEGAPTLLPTLREHPAGRTWIATSFGHALELVAPPEREGDEAPATPHDLVFHAPFEPLAGPRRVTVSMPDADDLSDASVTPLLDARGGVSLLLASGARELLVTPEGATLLEPTRAARSPGEEGPVAGGLLEGASRALVLGAYRRRTAFTEHGVGPRPPPIYVGLDRDRLHARALVLARRDDGALGALLLDGAAPASAAVALFDRATGTSLSPTTLAPWSSAIAASDPSCRKDTNSFRAVVRVDPAAWLDLDEGALPGVSLGRAGLALVRWGPARVCVEALDLATIDARRPASEGSASLVARFPQARTAVAALRSSALTQRLACSLGAKGR